MDFLSGAILSGFLHDGFKAGIKLTVPFLKEKLQDWLFDEKLLGQLIEHLQALELDEFAEHVIERKINESPDVLGILQQIKSNQTIGSVTQHHLGAGDNVAGNKTVNNN